MNIFSLQFAITLVCSIFAACLGSFANMIIYRWPRELSWAGRSFCPNCNQTLSLLALVPILSFLALGGKCQNCHKPISARYFWVEVFCAILGGLAGWFYWDDPISAALLILLNTSLIIVIGIDLSHRMIPDALNAFIAVLGLFWQFWQHQSDLWEVWPGLITGFLLFSISYGVAWGFNKVRQQDGLGGGDIKFLAAAGLWLEPALIPWLLGISGLIGVPMGLLWPKFFPNDDEPGFPFGPALAIGLLICIWFSRPLVAVFEL